MGHSREEMKLSAILLVYFGCGENLKNRGFLGEFGKFFWGRFVFGL